MHNVFADTPASTSMVLDLFNTTDRSPALGRISDMRDNCYVFDAPLLERFVVPGLEVFSSPAAFSAATGYADAHVMAAEPSDCQAALPTAVCMTAATGTTRRLLERFCDA